MVLVSETEKANLIARWSSAESPRIRLHPGVQIIDLIKWLKYPHEEGEIKTVREFLKDKVPDWF